VARITHAGDRAGNGGWISTPRNSKGQQSRSVFFEKEDRKEGQEENHVEMGCVPIYPEIPANNIGFAMLVPLSFQIITG
jgi:hypothetical protein